MYPDLDFDAVDDLLEALPAERRAPVMKAFLMPEAPPGAYDWSMEKRLQLDDPRLAAIVARIYAKREARYPDPANPSS